LNFTICVFPFHPSNDGPYQHINIFTFYLFPFIFYLLSGYAAHGDGVRFRGARVAPVVCMAFPTPGWRSLRPDSFLPGQASLTRGYR